MSDLNSRVANIMFAAGFDTKSVLDYETKARKYVLRDTIRNVASKEGELLYGLPMRSPILPGMKEGAKYHAENRRILEAWQAKRGHKPPAMPAPKKGVAPDGAAAPALHKNVQARVNNAPLNARGEQRKRVGKPVAYPKVPDHPLGSWTDERMEQKIKDDLARYGMDRIFLRTDKEIEDYADKKIRPRFGDKAAEDMKKVCLARDENGNRIRGRVVAPRDYDTFKGQELYQVQEMGGAKLHGEARPENMKWQPKPRPKSVSGEESTAAKRAAKKWSEFARTISGVDTLAKTITKGKRGEREMDRDPYAAATYVMAVAGLRPGRERDSGEPEASVGITALKVGHIKQANPRTGLVVLEFVAGKSAFDKETGERSKVRIEMRGNKELAAHLQNWKQGKSEDAYLFANPDGTQLGYQNLVKFTQERGGVDPKNLRTVLATAIAKQSVDAYLAKNAPPTNKTAFAKAIGEILQPVMQQLGHTSVSMSYKNYVDPNVWAALGNTDWLPEDLQAGLR